ncbi:hypothetical protein ONS95_008755 [Cadophora gregata]|uniref:uncharacterized protein n=1 Tax=Cadophora gregata TaxID=51156 RepID=UPI0026DC1560|nr:uncharacterized protein ONS95_008755 [Cadophora gregata]KAK0123748.1 hypothetical protein ONS95_008755 [Cadophora gregata]
MAQPAQLNPLLPTKTIHQFPLPTWIENLAIRSNGTMLVTLLTTPELYLIDPQKPSPSNATLIAKLPDVLGLTGIIEVQPDIFHIAGGNFSLSSRVLQDLGIADLSAVAFPNGFELLSSDEGNILIADSEIGAVWKLGVGDGKHEIAVKVEEMEPPAPPGMQIGINGIKIRDGYLYWTNTGKKTFCRVRIEENAEAVGDVEVLESDTLVDDFVFDDKGNAGLAQNVTNVIGVRRAAGGVVVAAGAGDELTVAGGTSCQFGRTDGDKHVLYVATSGGMAAPINGTVIEGGKVVGVDTSSFKL